VAVTIVTALYGGGDVIRPQAEQDTACRWLCHTDDPKLEVPEPWEKVVQAPQFKNPRLAAKVPKMLPEAYPWIWIDANIEITSRSFARQALVCVSDGMALYRHPRRDCIYTEAEASVGAESQGGKYDGQPIAEQVASYLASGHPEHGGLYACGTIAYDGIDPRFGPYWLAECARWSIQDQLSLPVVLRRLGIRPGVFPHRQITRRKLENPWLRLHPHSR
jgi:Protein of unknown function (DUF616)